MPTLRTAETELYYEDRGSGRPLLFLHGVMAGLRYFRPQLDGLAEEFRPIGLDFRGHGRSAKPPDGHTVAQYARDLRGVVRGLDLEDVVLVGWSMGALVAWEYIEQFGTSGIAAVVDVDMEPTRYSWDDYDFGTTDLDGLRSLIEEVQTDHIGLAERIVEPLLQSSPSPSLRSMMVDETTRCPPGVKTAILIDCTFRDYRSTLETLAVPMLVCAGVDGTWRSVRSVEYAAELAPTATVVHFEASGHCPSIEEPETFNRVLSEFVTTVCGRFDP